MSSSAQTGGGEAAPLPDAIGRPVLAEYAQELRLKVQQLLKYRNNTFPGAQPVALTTKNIQALEREDYFVCEKSDGVRYLMLLMQTQIGPATFMIDRKNELHYIENMRFPLPGRHDAIEWHNETLLDGELVVDVDGAKRTLTYLVFDLMTSNGEPFTHEPYSKRLGFFQRDVLAPYDQHIRRDPGLKDSQPFRIAIKTQQRSYGMTLIFDEIGRQKHGNDGLIFTPVNLPYQSGTCPKLLKWKPPDLLTVDFQIKIRYDKNRKPHYVLNIGRNGRHEFNDHLTVEPALANEWKAAPPDERIAEFKWDPEWTTYIWEEGYADRERIGGWRFMRFRDDKTMANDISVLNDTMFAIENGLTREALLSQIETIRSHWKSREAQGVLPPRPPNERKPSTYVMPSMPTSRHSFSRDGATDHQRRPSSATNLEISPEQQRRLSSGSIVSDLSPGVRREWQESRGMSPQLAQSPTSIARYDRRASNDMPNPNQCSALSTSPGSRTSFHTHPEDVGRDRDANASADNNLGEMSPTVAKRLFDVERKPEERGTVNSEDSKGSVPSGIGDGKGEEAGCAAKMDVDAPTSSVETDASAAPRKKSFTELVAGQMPKGIRLKRAAVPVAPESEKLTSPTALVTPESGRETDGSRPHAESKTDVPPKPVETPPGAKEPAADMMEIDQPEIGKPVLSQDRGLRRNSELSSPEKGDSKRRPSKPDLPRPSSPVKPTKVDLPQPTSPVKPTNIATSIPEVADKSPPILEAKKAGDSVSHLRKNSQPKLAKEAQKVASDAMEIDPPPSKSLSLPEVRPGTVPEHQPSGSGPQPQTKKSSVGSEPAKLERPWLEIGERPGSASAAKAHARKSMDNVTAMDMNIARDSGKLKLTESPGSQPNEKPTRRKSTKVEELVSVKVKSKLKDGNRSSPPRNSKRDEKGLRISPPTTIGKSRVPVTKTPGLAGSHELMTTISMTRQNRQSRDLSLLLRCSLWGL
ncbi:mRNA capping enzyme, catalytic domain-containing protein [Fimicolochytrium jonesii]|uniref:mRNA capping enzyme, catalytic domain-containing protein n=1 Tax=Fimicolochytrium jonesii TaxID=1396493 RepID=UPI0022FEBC9F|nr:mRNA capping enzyme, catalytic domain-containing protein [Fimicolochytrium jonesii]KAI8824071.1 mRNA capping enzyme, catalytic domain-containing protein [Fimicolochytrium jonesii]